MIDNPDPLGPLGRAFLASQSQADREALSDLSAQQINSMSFSEFARRTGRPTPTQAALKAYENQPEPGAKPRSSAPTGDSPSSNSMAPAAASEPAGRTLEELALRDPAAFAQWRASRKSSGENVGIFSGVTSNAVEYRQAAARQAGRSAMITSNVQEPRKVGRVYLADDIPPAGRKTYYR